MKRNFWIGLVLSGVASIVLLGMVGTAGAQDPGPKATPTPDKKIGTQQPVRPDGGGGPGPLPTGFTYQGTLNQNGLPVTDSCDMQFKLYDSYTGGTLLGTTTPLPSPVNVTNGLFTTYVDFGNQFTGDLRYLEILVRCPAGSGITETLTPRQVLYGTPYALGLRPGTIVSGTIWPVLTVRSTLTNANGFEAYANIGPNGWGIYAEGSGRGVSGHSDNGAGVYGTALTGPLGGTGVYGSGSTGVYGQGTSYGVNGNGLVGVYGQSSSDTGYGVYGYNSSNNGAGVKGQGSLGPGVSGVGTYTGVIGLANASNSSVTYGVYGRAYSVNGFGTYGYSLGGTGAAGDSNSGIGVRGSSTTNSGVFGVAGTAVGGEPKAGVVGSSLTNAGVVGYSSGPTVPAVYGHHAGDGPAIYGDGGGAYPAVEGLRSDNGTAIGGYATTGIAVQGYASTGNAFYGSSSGQARNQATLRIFNTQPIQGMAAYITNTSNFATAHFANASTGEVLYLQNGGTDANGTGGGDFIKAVNQPENDAQFRVLTSGEVRSDVGFNTPAADFAEMLPGAQGLEPGDVLVVDADGNLTRSTEAYQPTVVGVYSTQPGFVGGKPVDGKQPGDVPLAVVGVVPVKASAENGAIQPGDLLVASSTPGHAMKAGAHPAIGTVIGKALGSLTSGTGMIRMLVILQ